MKTFRYTVEHEIEGDWPDVEDFITTADNIAEAARNAVRLWGDTVTQIQEAV